MKKTKFTLEQFKIYSLQLLKESGYKFAKLGINRNLNENDIKRKMLSLKTTKGTVAPGIVVPAEQAIKEGLEVLDENGNKLYIDNPELGRYLIIIDGQHREEAIRRINAKVREKYERDLSVAKTPEERERVEKEYKDSQVDMFVMLPLNNDIKVVSLLEEVNVATRPWSGGDFLTKILNTNHDGIDLTPLKWIKEKMGSCSDTAAKLWGSMDASKSFSKTQLIKAGSDEEKLKELVNMSDHKFGVQIFESAQYKLGDDIVKLKVVPSWVIAKLSQLSADISKKEATCKLVKFFNDMTIDRASIIKGAKKTDSRTKEQVIKVELTKAWDEYILRSEKLSSPEKTEKDAAKS